MCEHTAIPSGIIPYTPDFSDRKFLYSLVPELHLVESLPTIPPYFLEECVTGFESDLQKAFQQSYDMYTSAHVTTKLLVSAYNAKVAAAVDHFRSECLAVLIRHKHIHETGTEFVHKDETDEATETDRNA